MQFSAVTSEYLGRPDKVLLLPLLTPAHRSGSLQVSKVVEFISKLDQFGLIFDKVFSSILLTGGNNYSYASKY